MYTNVTHSYFSVIKLLFFIRESHRGPVILHCLFIKEIVYRNKFKLKQFTKAQFWYYFQPLEII